MEAQTQYCERQSQPKVLSTKEITGHFPEKGRLTFYYALVVCPVENKAEECCILMKLKNIRYCSCL